MMKRLVLLLAALWTVSAFGATPQYIPDTAISPNIARVADNIPTGETNAVCVANTGTMAPSIVLCGTLDLTGKTVYYKPPEVLFANLPANHGIVIVTDCNTTSCTGGGGAIKVPMWWNGLVWIALGSGGGGGSGDVTDVTGTSNEICISNSAGPAPQVSLCSTVSMAAKILQLGRLDLSGDITPTALVAQTNDWAPTNIATASTIRVACSGPQNITGLTGGARGRMLTLYNAGSSTCTLTAEDPASTAANRFGFAASMSLLPKFGVWLQYDSTASRWAALSMPFDPSESRYCSDAGSTDAYACNQLPPVLAYKTGSHYWFRANTANTGAATISFNGLTALTIKKPIGGVTTDLDTNDIRVGQIVEVVYDGTNMQMVSMLGNSASGVTGTMTTGCVPKAASSSSVNDSSICEDADSINSAKKIEVGDVSTNSAKIQATGVSGKVVLEFETLRKKQITFRIGSDTGSALVDTQDEAHVWENQIGAMHITSIKCETDQGTSTINLQRDDGSAANILSSNLTCNTSGASSSSFTSGEDAIAVGHKINFVMVTAAASGTPKRISVTISAKLDSGA